MSPLMACSLLLAFQQTMVVQQGGFGQTERLTAGVCGDVWASEDLRVPS